MMRLFGIELSPYSIKVRSFLRYKGIEHEWIVRSMDQMPEFQKYAKLPLVPLLVVDDKGMQDSTPIMEHIEASFTDVSTVPNDNTLSFISALFEEYADEWLNKPMFHFRWHREIDQDSAATRIAQDMIPGEPAPEMVEGMATQLKARMISRVGVVGSSEQTAPLIEEAYVRIVDLLEAHFSKHAYLFGGEASFGDFGIYSQMAECLSDPTPGEIMKARAPRLVEWLNKMDAPQKEGELLSWSDVSDTLMPLLKELAVTFLPWTHANAKALMAGEESFSVSLEGGDFSQQPQKYHAKSLQEICRKYSEAKNDELDTILAEAGCLEYLAV